MSDWLDRLPVPPPTSPSARPALGLALCLNMLLAAGIHLGLSFATSAKITDSLLLELIYAAPVIYLALLLPIVSMYGVAAAAWTGWSWWRVPAATLAGATVALGVNAWAMAHWIAKQGWTVNPTLSVSDPRVSHLLFLAGFSVLVLIAIGLTLWQRWQSNQVQG